MNYYKKQEKVKLKVSKVDMRLNTPAYKRWKQGDKRYVAEHGVI